MILDSRLHGNDTRTMLTTLIFLLVLAVLIFVHELGHFLVARWCGIRVDAFKIGFGPKVFSWKRGETEYGLNLIPFGGYVKIFGENPDAENTTGADASRSMLNKPRWKQVAVLIAGVTFNFIFAWMLYVLIFTSGVTATTTGFEKYANDFTDTHVMITYVAPASPAEKSGIKVGDTIVAIGSEKAVLSTSTMLGLSTKTVHDTIVAEGSSTMRFEYSRQGQVNTVSITPVQGIVDGSYAIGIGMDTVGNIRLPFFTAVWEGLHYTGNMIVQTVSGLYDFVAQIFHGKPDFSQISGPIGIAGIVGDAAKLGFTYLLMITALISINLGVVNLIPFPALDGGRVLFVIIEALIRRRISPRFVNAINLIGFVLLMILMVTVSAREIIKLL